MSDRAGVRVVCHRGFNRVAPENTLAAANRAIAVGAHFVELDLRQSRDGVLYVMHDPTVDRSTNGSGVVSELTSLQIDRLDAGSWFGPQFRGEPVPRLGTFLRAVAGRTGVYVEIKDADPYAVAACVRASGMEHACFFFSSNPRIRAGLHAAAPEFRKMISIEHAGSVEAARHEHHAAIVEVRLSAASSDLRAAVRAAGMELMIYHDQPEAEAFARIIALRADYVNLDHPDLFMEVQRKIVNCATE